jgi:tRNA threonylcarbamoyladenosine biosynthesis protein TsaE
MHASDHTLQLELPDEAATLALGARLARVLEGGMTVFLEGDLGVGKTTLTRGILRGLGWNGRVKSPTYTLVEPYVISNLNFHHFDLYRFADPAEWEDAGFRDCFNDESVCLVEWPVRAAGFLPCPDWQITLVPQGTGRRCTLHALTETGVRCLARLAP